MSEDVRDLYPMQRKAMPCDKLCGMLTKRWVFDSNRDLHICWSCHSREQKETQEQFLKHIDHVRMFPHAHKDRHFITDGTQAYLIDDEGNYTSELKKPISSYILTKKPSQQGHISRNSK